MLTHPFFPEKTEKDISLDYQKVVTFSTGIWAYLQIEDIRRWAPYVDSPTSDCSQTHCTFFIDKLLSGEKASHIEVMFHKKSSGMLPELISCHKLS